MKKTTLALAVEFILIFVGIPLVFYFEWVSLPKIPTLVFLTTFCVVALLKDKRFDRTVLWNYQYARAAIPKTVIRFHLVAIALTAFTYFFFPELLFLFPKTRPVIWVIVMVFYPLLSALPQEFIYRAFLFHRYQSLFTSPTRQILVSAVVFSLLHIMYDNWYAVVLSLVGGLLFSRTFHSSKSLFLVSLEHALYGSYIFTVGLGHFFYEGF
ncbi:MAG: CPBP family intramembrane glutamic endopeptidase [Candidatus Zhuqueibacterota bacterium]